MLRKKQGLNDESEMWEHNFADCLEEMYWVFFYHFSHTRLSFSGTILLHFCKETLHAFARWMHASVLFRSWIPIFTCLSAGYGSPGTAFLCSSSSYESTYGLRLFIMQRLIIVLWVYCTEMFFIFFFNSILIEFGKLPWFFWGFWLGMKRMTSTCAWWGLWAISLRGLEVVSDFGAKVLGLVKDV